MLCSAEAEGKSLFQCGLTGADVLMCIQCCMCELGRYTVTPAPKAIAGNNKISQRWNLLEELGWKQHGIPMMFPIFEILSFVKRRATAMNNMSFWNAHSLPV